MAINVTRPVSMLDNHGAGHAWCPLPRRGQLTPSGG